MSKKKIKTILLSLTGLLLVMLISCDPSKKYDQEESARIQEYINSNPTLDFVLKPSGLYYMDVQPGSGRLAVAHDTAYVMFSGTFLDGTIFTSNVGTTDTLIVPVGEGLLVSGLDEGISYMKQGGKAILLCPSKLAYGAAGYYPYIQGYTSLLFDVELVRLKAGPGK